MIMIHATVNNALFGEESWRDRKVLREKYMRSSQPEQRLLIHLSDF